MNPRRAPPTTGEAQGTLRTHRPVGENEDTGAQYPKVEGEQESLSSFFSHGQTCRDSLRGEEEAVSAHRGRQGLGAAGGLVNTGGCVSAPPGRSHTGGGRPSSSTQGMTVPFCLLLPSGIWGVIEIIYQLMWADGLIKLNRKALAAGSECVTDSGRGTLRVTCQMCPWPSAGCPAGSPGAGVQAAFGVSAWEFRILTLEAGSSRGLSPSSLSRSRLTLGQRPLASWASPGLELDPPRGCWALGVQSPRGVHGGWGHRTPGLSRRRLRSWS